MSFSMFLSPKPTILLHVLPNALVWYGKNRDPITASLPPEVFRYLEVSNEAEAQKFLAAFMKDATAKGVIKGRRVVIVLSDGMVFGSALKTAETTDPAKAAQDFIDSVPLDPAARVTVSLPRRNAWFVVSANKQWLQLLVQSLIEAGAVPVCIVPVSAYGLNINNDAQKLEPEIVEQLLSSHKAVTLLNFLPLL